MYPPTLHPEDGTSFPPAVKKHLHMLSAVSHHYNIAYDHLPVHPHCQPSQTSNPEKVENDIISAFNYTVSKNMAIFNQIGVYEMPEIKSLSVLESYNLLLEDVINEIDQSEDGYLMDSDQAVYFLKNCSLHDELLILNGQSTNEYSENQKQKRHTGQDDGPSSTTMTLTVTLKRYFKTTLKNSTKTPQNFHKTPQNGLTKKLHKNQYTHSGPTLTC